MTAEMNPSVLSYSPLQSSPEGAIGEAQQSRETLSRSEVGWQDDEHSEENTPPVSSADPDLWIYRDRTAALLWRYTRLAVELGRLPSLLGREFFRARISRYDAQTFEDSVIFVHDVECCLQSLEPADKIVIAMLGLEQYTQEEAARSLRCTQGTISRHYGEALDRLSEIFLKRGILAALPGKSMIQRKACQEAKLSDFLVNDSL
jgi:DNA-directed RNA polymerase specialized sigma24 family protein